MRKDFYSYYLIGIISWVLVSIYVIKNNFDADFYAIEYIYDQYKLDLKTKNNSHNFVYLINPGRSVCDNDLFLIAFVCISPSSFEKRNVIRRTWANWKQFPSIRVVFLVGLSFNNTINSMLVDESKSFGDIVQEDFMDTYDNLTLKTIMGIKWVSTYCSNSIFSLKIDDDVVVNTPVLIKFLENQISYGNDKNCYLGSMQHNAPIIRSTNSKWFISQDELNGNYYPLYSQGPAYMFTTDLAEKFYQESLQTQFFRFEDIYVGFLANRIRARFIALNKLYLDLLYESLASISQSQASSLFVFLNGNSFEDIWQVLINPIY